MKRRVSTRTLDRHSVVGSDTGTNGTATTAATTAATTTATATATATATVAVPMALAALAGNNPWLCLAPTTRAMRIPPLGTLNSARAASGLQWSCPRQQRLQCLLPSYERGVVVVGSNVVPTPRYVSAGACGT